MQYISTRGSAPTLDFRGALLAGLASDGGLYVPASVPQFSPAEIAGFAGLTYQELALKIITPYVSDFASQSELADMIEKAYGSFRHAAIAPVTQLSHDHFLLELFHGPTLAFKDFALQLLGHFYEHALRGSDQKSVVLGATSGDTGSAAIAGLRGRAGIDIAILYPAGRTSDVQRRQMTTVIDANVHALCVEGTFDDCQDLVKALFGDAAFRTQVNLLAVNSINWARVMAQIVYYFYAALSLGAPARRVNFCVPTGNFGDIYAGYLARAMGLPMGKLIIASNKNDILARCVATGEYAMHGVSPSHSPSMDIEISSNFERLLFDLHGRDGALMAKRMQDFRSTKSLKLSPAQHADFIAIFAGHKVDDAATLDQIKRTHETCGILIDPHTAVGIAATEAVAVEGTTVTLATAHPAKFPDAVRAATGIHAPLPAHLADLYERTERITPMANNEAQLKEFLLKL
ncbi:MAG: threonine synthase [Rhodospirillales bacterium 12-54-5]|nr:MAG: threonine synthase [Rhodospirillales bacterium 12-54-5]